MSNSSFCYKCFFFLLIKLDSGYIPAVLELPLYHAYVTTFRNLSRIWSVDTDILLHGSQIFSLFFFSPFPLLITLCQYYLNDYTILVHAIVVCWSYICVCLISLFLYACMQLYKYVNQLEVKKSQVVNLLKFSCFDCHTCYKKLRTLL